MTGRGKRQPKKDPTAKKLDFIPVTQQGFRDAICEAIRTLGRAKARDLLSLLGPEWTNPKSGRIVAQTLVNMKNVGWLTKDAEKFYSLAPGYDARRDRLLEPRIVKVVRDLGGYATTSQILDAFGCRPKVADRYQNYDPRFNSDFRRIMQILKDTDHLLHPYGMRGVYALTEEEIERVPLAGRWIEFRHIEEFAADPANGRKELPYYLVRDFFEKVGDACWHVRLDANLSPEQVLEDRGIAAAFREMSYAGHLNVAPYYANMRYAGAKALGHAYEEIRENAEDDAARAGRKDDVRYIEELREQRVPHILEYLLVSFEYGEQNLHRISTARLFRAYEKRFGVSAVALSRGVIERVGDSPAG